MSILRACRSGSPCGRELRKPDVRSVESFTQTVLKTECIAIPASTSGLWLTKDLFPRLGIAAKLNVKTMPRGADATRAVAAGEANLGILPVSEIMSADGVDFVGALAAEIQLVQTFSAAVVAGSKQRESAQRLIDCLMSVRAAAAIRDSGMEPIAK